MAVEGTTAYDEVLDFLTSAPTPEQIIAFRPSEETQERVRYLLAANKETRLTAEEQGSGESDGCWIKWCYERMSILSQHR